MMWIEEVDWTANKFFCYYYLINVDQLILDFFFIGLWVETLHLYI